MAIGAVVLVTVWQQVGFVMVLYLAGLQAIPGELRAAAQVDGASPWQTFRHVVLPLLAPSVTINVVLGFTGYLKLYELVIALTNGNPAGRTETTVMRIFEDAFTNGRPGLAAAESIVLAVLTAVLSTIIILARRKSERAVE
jgi:ABC-type sugar transport system permease subunit